MTINLRARAKKSSGTPRAHPPGTPRARAKNFSGTREKIFGHSPGTRKKSPGTRKKSPGTLRGPRASAPNIYIYVRKSFCATRFAFPVTPRYGHPRDLQSKPEPRRRDPRPGRIPLCHAAACFCKRCHGPQFATRLQIFFLARVVPRSRATAKF